MATDIAIRHLHFAAIHASLMYVLLTLSVVYSLSFAKFPLTMASSLITKGQIVEETTLLRWGTAVKVNIGYKTEMKDGRTYVNFIWCKLCAKYKDKLAAHPNLRGAAKKSVEIYASGTNTVTKSNTLRHLDGKAHALALLLESGQERAEGENICSANSEDGTEEMPGLAPKQPRIDQYLDQTAHEAYTKLMKTAYQLAVHAMPFNEFKILVKIQKENGVSLIKGKDDSRVAKDLINCLSNAVREKLATILLSKKVFSSLSDGSQARKSGADKELIFIRVEIDGRPVYYCIGLEDLSHHGGANADGIKAAHDKVFSCINDKLYNDGMISCTADGASVNFGRWEGFLAKMTTTRPWLLSLHCVNHRAELAAKSVFESQKCFQEIDDLYIGIRNLFKNSGRLKSELKHCCESLNITYYSMQKIHGTRFQHQRRKGFKRFLHMWIAIANTFENALCQPTNNYRPETRAKLTGYLKKLRRFDILVNLSLYYDILDTLGILSLTFEKKTVLVSEVEPARDRTLGQLNEILEETLTEENIISKHFKLVVDEDGCSRVEKTVSLKGHERKQTANKAFTTISMTVNMLSMDATLINLNQLKQKVIVELKAKYISRFESFDDPIVQAMMFIDPKYWDPSDKDYGVRDVLLVVDFFDGPLNLLEFDRTQVIAEWQSLKRLVLKFYSKHSVEALWPKIFEFRKNEFPNVCKVVSMVMTISVSNSTVERGFSALSLLLSDRRLHLSHESLESILLVKINHLSFSISEREEIIKRAVTLYLSKRRVKRIHSCDSDKLDARMFDRLHDNSQDTVNVVSSSEDDLSDEMASTCSESDRIDELVWEC